MHLVGDAPINKHTVFVDNEDAAGNFSPAEYFNTDADLVDRAFNRPRKETLESQTALGGAALNKKELTRAKRARESSYAELDRRIDRSTKMARLAETIDRDRELLKKGRRVKVEEAKDGRPAVFMWKTQRKK